MTRALVTGVAGFVGGHLAAALAAAGDEVIGLSRASDPPRGEGVGRWVQADLTDGAATRAAVARARPTVVYHLAALSSPRESMADPAGALRHNVEATANVLEAALACEPRPRVLLVTSSDVYDSPPPEASPLTEDSPFRPQNPYAVSKVAVHYLGRQYHDAHGLEVIEARPFNHIGPGQRLGFVVPDFASQVAAIAAGRQAPVLEVGDLTPRRDFTDVRDIVRGYRLLAHEGQPGRVYQLCSGDARSIRWLLDTLIELAGIDAEVRTDAARVRTDSTSAVWGSSQRIERELGWRPEIPLERTLAEVVDEWRGRVDRG